MTYHTYVVDPATVFTYTPATRSFKVETSSYSSTGNYIVNLEAKNPYDSTNSYILTFRVTISRCALTFTAASTQIAIDYY